MNNEEKTEYIIQNIDFGKAKLISCRVEGAEGFSATFPNGFSIDIWYFGKRISCYLKKKDSTFLPYSFAKLDDKSINIIQHCVKEIENGKYNNKKTLQQSVNEILQRRGLTSYMNNTKWREFQNAMIEEMPFSPPYVYKSLFEDGKGRCFDFSEYETSLGDYSAESFACNHYSIIEWVKVRPGYYSVEGGRLCPKFTYHDARSEFESIMKKYSISFEMIDGVYIIYGYK